jgi:hypothetical protein
VYVNVAYPTWYVLLQSGRNGLRSVQLCPEAQESGRVCLPYLIK